MSRTYCIGQFVTPISSSLPARHHNLPEVGFLQRSHLQIHVYRAPRERIGDLSTPASKHLGPLLGTILTCSTPVSSSEISPTDPNLMKLRLFVVTRPAAQPELWGLTPLTGLEFLKKNESASDDMMLLWNHPNNALIHRFIEQAGISTPDIPAANPSQGSILADEMGLRKTLTTLTYALAARDLAFKFYFANLITRSAGTLIKIHFKDEAINYHVFHGPDPKNLRKQDLQSALVVLTTYKMIGDSVNRSPKQQLTVESLNLCWFRIVLDEAHLIRNPYANRSQNIRQLQSQFLLCLMGTPIQNCLTDLQSLITTLKIALWDDEMIWQQCLIPKMNVGAAEAIKSITQLMTSICLRRTKEVLLNLPKKVEHAVLVRCSSKWEPFSRELHSNFIWRFGSLRVAGEQWDPAEFFRQLMMLRQFCNHPIFARAELPMQPTWHWQDSGKAVHLIASLKTLLSRAQGIRRPKAVIFCSFVGFLEIASGELYWIHSTNWRLEFAEA
ncbi:hypothetical protein PTTG_29109 [Puccinia triticina 1-1 BBBD Race 1]|uniref:Helicase ATP-binding domain-containing protein n=1 Tax=Puccinia triticina (isolate 1-1 / race 1 (BBBD)) TaxID=630390 RepID=A0A180G6B3_PUCT1|nr:hypothetical protein PTTG_29109 [Puccinia triticina 1-1 BBBD Race 1]